MLYTARDHTNYHFEVGHHAFEGALDRFSQFFIAPLFSEKYTEREVKAVDSEFERNRDTDGWRVGQVINAHLNPDHPRNSFNVGNETSLKDIKREEFIEFYEKYYSADQMALALTGNCEFG